jgi:RimJ/RimL family protein N-acetyltransferase
VATRLHTARLEVISLDTPAVDAWIAGDAAALERLTSARFPTPVDFPPLLGEDLARLRATAHSFGVWLFVLRDTREPVGAGGVGPLGPGGVLELGYSIWPRHQRQGFATEGALALTHWALSRSEVRAVRATVPPSHARSIRVVEKCGFRRAGTAHDPEAGEVIIFEKD